MASEAAPRAILLKLDMPPFAATATTPTPAGDEGTEADPDPGVDGDGGCCDMAGALADRTAIKAFMSDDDDDGGG